MQLARMKRGHACLPNKAKAGAETLTHSSEQLSGIHNLTCSADRLLGSTTPLTLHRRYNPSRLGNPRLGFLGTSVIYTDDLRSVASIVSCSRSQSPRSDDGVHGHRARRTTGGVRAARQPGAREGGCGLPACDLGDCACACAMDGSKLTNPVVGYWVAKICILKFWWLRPKLALV